jgi:predicted nucleic acid-binding protein
VYLIDTNVISEARKGRRADIGVRQFFTEIATNQAPVFLSVITVGELRRGVALIRHRGDALQARRLERWLQSILSDFAGNILDVDVEVAQLWGRLCAPHAENALDKLVAATALIHDLTVVTRNGRHFNATGVPLLNPFSGGP